MEQINKIGELRYNNEGKQMKIIKYIDCNNVIVQFENGYQNIVQYGNFKRGSVASEDKKNKRINEIGISSKGQQMKIIKYPSANHIDIQFEDGYIARDKTYKCFQQGTINNPYFKSILNIGYIGEGKYKVHINNKPTRNYKTWVHMLGRCYDEESYENQHSYKNCIVCDEWHNFQNFAKWYEENYYIVNNKQNMGVDKDILYKGNKIYSPKTCIFVPQAINSLFTKDEMRRGDYPIGVSHESHNNGYRAQCNYNGTVQYLGHYNTINEAFNTYKIYKEKLIKQIANEYKDKIPKILYDAMYKYEVEMTD